MNEFLSVSLMYKILNWIKFITKSFKIMSYTLPLPLQNTWELVEKSQKDNQHGGKLRSPRDVDENLHKHLFLPGNPVLWLALPGMKIVAVIANSKLSINVFFILHTYILALFFLFSKIMGRWYIFTVATIHHGTKMTLDELYINCIYCIYSMKNHSIHVKMEKMENTIFNYKTENVLQLFQDFVHNCSISRSFLLSLLMSKYLWFGSTNVWYKLLKLSGSLF